MLEIHLATVGRSIMKLNRQTTFLTDQQLRVLKNQQKKTGMSISTLIRQAVTEFIDALERGKQRGTYD
jgi:hypothetical protein